jgi:hypothetical protein
MEWQPGYWVPGVPNHVLYVYFPIFDDELPDLSKLHALVWLGATFGRGDAGFCHIASLG